MLQRKLWVNRIRTFQEEMKKQINTGILEIEVFFSIILRISRGKLCLIYCMLFCASEKFYTFLICLTFIRLK